MTPPPKDAYVCKKCGYVLPKRDAVVSGWDAEGSLKHVHCPKCGKPLGYITVFAKGLVLSQPIQNAKIVAICMECFHKGK